MEFGKAFRGKPVSYVYFSSPKLSQMDPITLAIVAAVTGGVTSSAGKVAEKAIVDAYEGLKGLIKKKFGVAAKVPKAIDDLESEPDFKPFQEGLKQRVESSMLNKDMEIVKAAQELLTLLKAKPDGKQAIQNIQNVYGDYNAVAGPYGKATVNFGQIPPKSQP